MMLLLCHQCGRSYRIVPKSDPLKEFDLLKRPEWQDSFPCITGLCGGRLRPSPHGGAHKIVDMTVLQFYQVLSGLDAGPITNKRLREAAIGKKIVDVTVEAFEPEFVNQKRVIVNAVVLDDGTRLHLAPSTYGACIYKIEEPDHGCDRTAGDGGSAAPHGEEAGRAAKAPGVEGAGPAAVK